ncbi:MAG: DEAD/DEAH box helicase [Deltaproteobacteria bacterium]|nr:DEAD/DEAH box helicase [Deltaproteobacteria bacterium]
MKITPRPYQKKAVESVISLYENGSTKMLLHLPTGAGKTIIATIIIEQFLALSKMGKILFIAHREEILDQTQKKIKHHLPRVDVRIEQGNRTSSKKTQITIASVQSLIRRKEKYNPQDFSLIICDECHRALAPSWTDVISYFYENKNTAALLLGMTATPKRTDGRSALSVFNEIAFEISRVELQDLGFLVPIEYFTVRTDLNLDKVKISGGDYQVGSLSKVMNTAERRALTLDAWREKGLGKKTIAFCAGVEHARQMAVDFGQLGIKAQVVDARTSNRKEILRKFRSNKIGVLTNYGVLTEGFDDPGIECILMARPTTSPLVYTQCIGRGLRPSKGKKACTVIDIIDRSKHQLQYGAADMCGLPRNWNSRGRDPQREVHALSKIKTNDVEAFLKIKQAQTLEEVQTILMSLDPQTITAGLDGEPVVYYESSEEKCSLARAQEETRKIFKQTSAPIKRIFQHKDVLRVSFAFPEINNEKFQYIKWHLESATGWPVEYVGNEKKSNPKAFLNSMLNENQRIKQFSIIEENKSVAAWISNLSNKEVGDISDRFKEKTGLDLEIKGQIPLF